jgi:hypothetical protein
MFFQPAATTAAAAGGQTARWAAVLCAVLVVGVGAWPGRWIGTSIRSEEVLRPATRTVNLPADRDAPRLARDARP